MIISINKPLVLINNNEEKSPVADTLPGDSLSGEQSPTARCAGAKMREILGETVAVLINSSPTLPEPHP